MAPESNKNQSAMPSTSPGWRQLPPQLGPMSAHRAVTTIAFAATAAAASLLALRFLAPDDLREVQEFNLWEFVVSVQVALWVVFTSLLMRHLSLMIRAVGMRLAGQGVRVSLNWRVAGFVLTVWIVVAASLAVMWLLDLLLGAPDSVRWAVLVFTVVGGLAALPALATASFIREFASSDALWPPHRYGEADFAFIQFLRREFRTVVGILGVVVAMIVLTTGGLSDALNECDKLEACETVDASDARDGINPPTENMRTKLVLAGGAFYSSLLIAGYIYGRAAINRRATEMLDAWAPLPAPNDPIALEKGLDWRQKLAGHLGLDTTLREGLAATAIVALPLLSAFMSSLVGQDFGL